MPWAPACPILRPPGDVCPFIGVTTRWSERLAGGSVRRVAGPALNKHRPQAAFFPETRQCPPPTEISLLRV